MRIDPATVDRIRAEKGLTYDQISARAADDPLNCCSSWSRVTVKRLRENEGKCTPLVANKLARGLEVEVSDLLA